MPGLYSAQSAVKFTTIMTMKNPGLSIQVKLLGDLAVSVNSQPRELPASRKCRGLLAWMLSNVGPHRRETLCELLWSDTDDPRAGLRWALTKLRPWPTPGAGWALTPWTSRPISTCAHAGWLRRASPARAGI